MESFARCSGDSWCSWRVTDIKYEASLLAQALCNVFKKQVCVVVCFCCWLWNWAAPPKQSFHFWHHFDPRWTSVVSLLKHKAASTFIVYLHTAALISLLFISSKRHLVSLIALFASGITFSLFSLHYLWLPCLAPFSHEVRYPAVHFPKLLDGKIKKSPLNLASGPVGGSGDTSSIFMSVSVWSNVDLVHQNKKEVGWDCAAQTFHPELFFCVVSTCVELSCAAANIKRRWSISTKSCSYKVDRTETHKRKQNVTFSLWNI